MKKFLILLLVLILSISLIACNTDADDDPVDNGDIVGGEDSLEEDDEDKDEPGVTVDRAGLEFKEVESTDSIVSLAPSITEILVDMGYGDNLVAADGPESESREGVPQDIIFMDMMAPDVEQLIALDPDVIFATTMSFGGGEDPLKAVKDQGISVVYIPSSESIEEIYEDILFIGQVLDDEEASEEIVNDMKEQIGEIRARNEDRESITVLFEIAAAPDIYSFGDGVFLNEMMEILGFENILADNEGWMSVSEEIVVDKNPQIIFTNVAYIENPVEEILSRDGWDVITAVSNEDVYYIDNSASSLPNHNIVKALLEMEEAVR